MNLLKRTSFYTNGVLVIDDFLDDSLSMKLFTAISTSIDHDQIRQAKPNHYKTILKSDYPNFPKENEIYYASFKKYNQIVERNRSTFLEFQSIIKNNFQRLSVDELRFYTSPLCYKMSHGDFIRLHKDLYAGEIGYTYYLNKNWSWDWGGIFNFYSPETESMHQILPKFNRIVIRNEKNKLFHNVSYINEFSKEDRLSINGWASIEDKTEELKNKTIGSYKK